MRAPSELPAVVRAEDVHKQYADLSVAALGGVDVEIGAGEIVALRGPSGSGKSTLLHILGCLDRPTRGRLWLGGRDVSQLTREEQAWVRLHHIGFVFQAFNLIGTDTALENVALPLYYQGVPRRERERRALDMLARVDLVDRASHTPSELSGGQRQRIAIARACVTNPPLLLADEPTGALDTASGRAVLRLLRALHEERNLTIVLVTHDPEIAAFADRTIFMRDGKIEHPEGSHVAA